MLAAALAVAEDDQVLLAEIAEEIIEVNGGHGEEDAAFVSGFLEHLVEAAFEDDAGGQVHAMSLRAVHFGFDCVCEQLDGGCILLDGEAFVLCAGVPAILVELERAGEVMEGGGEVDGELAGGGEEGEDGFFEFFEAGGLGEDDFGVVDVDSLAAFAAGFGGDAAEEFPEAGEFFLRSWWVAVDFEGAAADDEWAEDWAVACFVDAGEEHGFEYNGEVAERGSGEVADDSE